MPWGDRRSTCMQMAMISLAVAAVYGMVFWLPFSYDDVRYILNNPFINGLPMSGGPPVYISRQPLVTLLHRALFISAGGDPFPFRLAGIFFHLATVFFVLKYFQVCFENRSLAFMGAALYALHPTHIETLAVASFQGHLLSGVCVMAAVWLYGTRTKGAVWILAFYLGGLFSKEGAVVLPFLCALEAGRRGVPLRDIVFGRKFLAAGFVLITAVFFLERLDHMAEQAPQIYLGGGFINNLLTMTNAFRWDWAYFFYPVETCLEHSLPLLRSFKEPRFLLSALFVLALIGACAASYRHGGILWFGILWACLSLAPFMNLIPFLNFSIVANRYLYLAGVGMMLVLVTALRRVFSGQAAVPICGVVLALYVAFDFRTLAAYSDPLEFWKKTARCAPANPRAYANLGLAYAQGGLFDPARQAYQRAIGISPEFAEPYLELAKVLFYSGRLAQAIELTEQLAGALEGQTGSTEATTQLAYFYLASGRFEKAGPLLKTLLAQSPDNPEILLYSGISFMAQKDTVAAEQFLKRAALDPQYRSDAFSALGQLYIRLGDAHRAMGYFENALTSDPGREDSIFKLARLYVSAGKNGAALQLLKTQEFKLQGLREDLESSKDDPARELAALLDARLRKLREEGARLLPATATDVAGGALAPARAGPGPVR